MEIKNTNKKSNLYLMTLDKKFSWSKVNLHIMENYNFYNF